MAADRVGKRREAAEKLYMQTDETLEGADGRNDHQSKKNNVLSKKKLWDELWKTLKREQIKWWEATALMKYVECERIPRGLRIFIVPTLQDPDPELIERWMENNHVCSMNMLRMLITSAEKESKRLLEESEKITKTLQEMYPKEEFENEMNKMNKKLERIEEDIKLKKLSKFQRDERDYKAGRILTFGKKYDQSYADKTNDVSELPKEMILTTPTNETEEDVTETITTMDNIDINKDLAKARILNEFTLLAKERNPNQSYSESPGRSRGRGGRGGSKPRFTRQEVMDSPVGSRTRGRYTKK